MKIPKEWLDEILGYKTDAVKTADGLTNAGIETAVQGTVSFTGVVTARVIKTEKIREKISLVTVFDGQGERTVICGAPNVREGLTVALALPGAVLAGGLKIEERKTYGYLSSGMICAEDELGLGSNHSGIIEVDGSNKPGEPFIPAGLNEILEFEVTPNRGDCLSVFGIAREIEASAGRRFLIPEIPLFSSGSRPVELRITAPLLCPRYTAGIADGISVTEGRPEIRKRLEASGLSAINNIVDLTNYILLLTGQPLHVFDYDKLAGGKIIVRPAASGEELTTLDGIKRKLLPEDLVIADSEKPLALAGLMGGLDSSVTGNTKIILIESAVFSPAQIRKTSRRLGLITDASYRFERGVDFRNCMYSQRLMNSMLSSLYKARIVSAPADTGSRKPRREVEAVPETIRKILSGTYTDGEIFNTLENLGFDKKENNVFFIPDHRNDVSDNADLAEEIGRIKGYSGISPEMKMPSGSSAGVFSIYSSIETGLRETLSGAGFFEAVNFIFTTPEEAGRFLPEIKPVSIINPLNRDESALSPLLIPGLLRSVKTNLSYGSSDIRIFELGRVFNESSGVYKEKRKLAAACTGIPGLKTWNSSPAPADFFYLKGILAGLLETLGLKADFTPDEKIFLKTAAGVTLPGENISLGFIGRMNQETLSRYDIRAGEVFVFEIFLDQLEKKYRMNKRIISKSRFPLIDRDLAIIIDETVPEIRIEDTIRKNSKYLESCTLFDYYRGSQIAPGKKSLAYKLIFRGDERTLTDQEVNMLRDGIISALAGLGAVLREK